MESFYQIYSPHINTDNIELFKQFILYNDRTEPTIFYNAMNCANDLSTFFLHTSTILIIWFQNDIDYIFREDNIKIINKIRQRLNLYHIVIFEKDSKILSNYLIDHHIIPLYEYTYPKYNTSELELLEQARRNNIRAILKNEPASIYILDNCDINIIKKYEHINFVIDTNNKNKSQLLKYRLNNLYEQLIINPLEDLPHNTFLAICTEKQNCNIDLLHTIYQLGQIGIVTYHNFSLITPYSVQTSLDEYINKNNKPLNIKLNNNEEKEIYWLNPIYYENSFYTKRSYVHLVHMTEKLKVEYIPNMSNLNDGVYQDCIISKNKTYLIRVRGYKDYGCDVNLWIATPTQQTILFTPEYSLTTSPGTLQFLFENKQYNEIIVGLMFYNIKNIESSISFYIQSFDIIPIN